MSPLHLVVLLSLVVLPDHGIWPDLDPRVRIAAPAWTLDAGPSWVRVDLTHRVVTVYQGGAAVIAYSLRRDGTAGSRAELLPLLDPGDAADLSRLVGKDVRVEQG